MFQFLRQPRARTPILLAIAALLTLSFLWIQSRYHSSAATDPDRFFHLALAKKTAESGIIRSLPQAEDIGWEKHYGDKEFLFRVVTAVAYKIGGESAVTHLIPLMGVAILLSIFLFLNAYAGTWAGFWASCFILTNFVFLYRINLLRPHVFAILIFVWITFALLKRSQWLLFSLCVVFAWAYHAYYLPLVVLSAWAALSIERQHRSSLKYVFYGVAGLLVGMVVYPYFPENILISLQHVAEATQIGLPHSAVPSGYEMVPYKPDAWLEAFFGTLCVIALTVLALFQIAFDAGRSSQPQETLQSNSVFNLKFLLLSVLGFVGISFINPRASEYLIPLAAILVGFSLPLVQKKWARWAFPAVLAAQILILPPVREEVANARRAQSQDTFDAIAKIPADAVGKKVFHDSWAMGEYLLYVRPDLRFVDLLDTNYLVRSNPQKSALRDQFLQGEIADPYAMLKLVFDASYVLAQFSKTVSLLDHDPNFIKLYPEGPRGGSLVSLFALRPHRIPNQIVTFEAATMDKPFSQMPRPSQVQWQPWSPSPQAAESLGGLAMIDFRSFYKSTSSENASGGTPCVLVRPTTTDMKLREGSEYVSLGGGQRLDLWWNGRLLYSSTKSYPDKPSLNEVLVPLPRPLKAQDQLNLLTCSHEAFPYQSFAISLWSDSELRTLCGGSSNEFRPGQNQEFARSNWKYCLAPLAYPLAQPHGMPAMAR